MSKQQGSGGSMLNDLFYRLRALVRRRHVERELDEELRLHLAMQADKHVDAGMPREEAMRRARIELGGFDQVKEQTRDAWGVRMLDSTWQDVVYAGRMLRKKPGFTIAVALSLALGIGANTAIFTLIDAVMWRPLPIDDPDGLLVAGRREQGGLSTGFTYEEFERLHDGSTEADVAGYATAPLNVSVDGSTEPGVQGQLVSGGYFALLGVRPVLGRAIGPDDDLVPAGHPVAMLSHGYWKRRFAQDPSVIGRTIRISAMPFTVIGVTPPGFAGVEAGRAPDVFVPIAMQPTVMPAYENLLQNAIVRRWWVQAVVRLRPPANTAHAAAAMDARLRDEDGSKLVLSPTGAVSALRLQFSRPLAVLLAMVGVVLLVACANTANLLLARASARRPELAMRLALGAGRGRLVRQLLVESVMLAGLGGLCGVLLAHAATRLLVAFMSSGRTAISLELAPNLRILAFTAAVSSLTGLLFGLAPAWRATRIDLVPALKNVRGSLTRSLRPDRLLTIAQLALSLLLLVCAGLFVRSLHGLNGSGDADVRDRVVVLRVEPKGSDQRNIPGTSERLDRVYRELIDRIGRIPGVQSVSMGQGTPTTPTASSGAAVALASGEKLRVPILMVYPAYFATIGTPIVRGRDFEPADLLEHAPAVCVVNETFVRRVFGGANPLGKPCEIGSRARLVSLPRDRRPEPFTIVGVVADSRYSNPTGAPEPRIYQTFLQSNTGRGQMVLHVRVDGRDSGAAQRIREQVAAVDPTVPMFDVHTLAEEMNAALVQQRLIAVLSSAFGTLALALACVGLYGLLAFTVVQRRTEMGIRMALGAARADVVRLVAGEAMRLVAAGLAIGVPAAIATGRLASNQIAGLLFGLDATDSLTIAAAVVVLAAVACVAAYLPARRASLVDPMVALRTE